MKNIKSIITITLLGIFCAGILLFRHDLADHIVWCQARVQNRLFYYERYARKFPQGHHMALANLKLQDGAKWRAVKSTEDLKQVRSYLTEYPEGLFLKEAQDLVLDLEYLERMKACQTAQSVDDLMQKEKVPSKYFGRSRGRIKELAMSELEALNTEQQLDDYLTKSPITQKYEYEVKRRRKRVKYLDQQKEEERLAWEKALKRNEWTSYNGYLRNYPQGKYAQEAKKHKHDRFWAGVISDDHPNLRTFDENDNLVPAIKTVDIYYGDYTRYLEYFPEGEHVEEAQTFIDEYLWGSVSRHDRINRYLEYMKECPYGAHVLEAKERIEHLRNDTAIYERMKTSVRFLLDFVEDYPGHVNEPDAIEVLVHGLLHGRYRKRVAKMLKEKGWEPQTEWERIYFAVAYRDKNYVQKHRAEAVQIFLESVATPQFDAERYGALYALIDIGEDAAIPRLKEILREQGSTGLAEAYLNCGHKALEDFARSWAQSKGYSISQSQFGFAPARWGKLK